MRRNPSSPRGEISTTLKIRSLGREAAANELISERLNHWKAVMRERGALACHMPSGPGLGGSRKLSDALSLLQAIDWFSQHSGAGNLLILHNVSAVGAQHVIIQACM